jgi:hypothetical protein
VLQGIVLGIDRHDLDIETARIGHESVAGADEAFLIGQGNPPPRLQGSMGRGKACGSADGGKDDVSLALGGFQHGSLSRSAVDSRSGERLPQGLASALVGKGCKFCSEAAGHLRQGQCIAATHNGLDPERVRVSKHHVRRRTADRTGCSKNREGTGHQGLYGGGKGQQNKDDETDGPEAVKSIHDSAMPWDEMARILDLTMALEC